MKQDSSWECPVGKHEWPEAETQIAQGVPLLDGEGVFMKLRDKYARK